MRLDISIKTEHSDISTAVTWTPDNQLISCSDDKVLCRWASDGEVVNKITSITTFITGISWLPVVGKQSTDTFVISCTDGTYRFVSRSGREEKKVSAHEGAVILVKWSHDGSTLLTGGEDGDVKIWSKSGNLRSTLASTGQSLYCACWGPDDDQVLIGNGNTLMIKSIQASRKNLQWNAHDGIILCVDWNIANNLIVSGGEDCYYRVWDAFGRQLFLSRKLEHVITSIAWCPNGECFAVGSHDLLRLCDKTGWTHCRDRISSGSILNIAWTPDGTQFAGAGGNGSVVFAQVVDRKLEWKNTEVTLIGPRKLRVQDAAQETLQDLELSKDRVVEMGLGFEHLIVSTTFQCSIYSLANLNTPIIIDIRAPPHFIHLCLKNFLTLDQISGLQIISFDGRTVSAPRFQGMRPEYLTRDMVALSPDTVVIVDTVDSKHVHIMDTAAGRPLGKVAHNVEIVQVCLNQFTIAQERLLVFSDRNKDFFIVQINPASASANTAASLTPFKLMAHVESFCFNDEIDALSALSEKKLHLWYLPSVPFIDKDLLSLTTIKLDTTELGQNSQITSYTGTRIAIRKADGTVVFAGTPIYLVLLYQLARQGKWDESLRLCRHEKNSALWTTLAAMSLLKKQLEITETCLAEVNEVAKVEFIQAIKDIPSEEGKLAEMALLRRQPEEAERILLQASPPLVYRAIKTNIRLFRWERALEIAIKFKSHVDTVLGYRHRYLDNFNRKEDNQRFRQYAESVAVDWEVINAKEQKECEDEAGRALGANRRK